jgi:hypothetical protein
MSEPTIEEQLAAPRARLDALDDEDARQRSASRPDDPRAQERASGEFLRHAANAGRTAPWIGEGRASSWRTSI